MDYCVSLFWLLCLESSCPNVCPLSRCESLLHNNYRKGVPVHPARNTRASGTTQICLNLKIWEVDSFFFLHLSSSFISLGAFSSHSCCAMSAKPHGAFCKRVKRCLSGLTANAQTAIGNLFVFSAKQKNLTSCCF